MKNNVKILMLLTLLMFKSYGQDSLFVKKDSLKTQIFSISPISKKVEKVNGLVFGVGHVDNKHVKLQTINGLNIEANPAPAAGALIGLMILIYSIPDGYHKKSIDTIKKPMNLKIEFDSITNLKIRGLNLSTGCFFTNTRMDGLNISLGNKFKNLNGLSITPLGTISDVQNGISVGIINANNELNGLNVGVYNRTYELNGLQIGITNFVENNHGIQIGIFNQSLKRGLQIGIWNKNNKRSFPFINW
jgi:hypothetical protein